MFPIYPYFLFYFIFYLSFFSFHLPINPAFTL